MKRSIAALFLASLTAGQAYAEARVAGFDQPHRADEFIVRFKDGSVQNRALFRELGVTQLKAFTSSPSYLVKATAQGSAAVLASLKNNPDVVSIQPNRIFKIMKAPSDPKFSAQYHHNKIGSKNAWEISTGSKSVVVAIIDTGVNYQHPDIAPNYWTNPGESGLDTYGNNKATNGVDDDANGYIDDYKGWDFVNNDNDPMDDHGHGTHCAGLIGAKGDNGIGATGVNWEVSLVGLKFINGQTGEGDTAGAVAAIEYATTMGFPVTSNSWGGPPEIDTSAEAPISDVLEDAIKANTAAGAIFVAAAGNESSNNDFNIILPAGYEIDAILTVAATTIFDGLAFFSNYGLSTVDIAAPGSTVYSTVLGDRYEYMSGTSMAAPVVAGAAALVKAVHPDWNGVQIKEQLMKTVDPLSGLTSKVKSGGRLNIGRAVAE